MFQAVGALLLVAGLVPGTAPLAFASGGHDGEHHSSDTSTSESGDSHATPDSHDSRATAESGDNRATAYSGNITDDGGGHNDSCSTRDGGSQAIPSSAITFSGGTQGSTYLTITGVSGWTLDGVAVKGGDAYNWYANLGNLPWSDLHAPLNASGAPAGISHWVACGTPTSPTPPPSTESSAPPTPTVSVDRTCSAFDVTLAVSSSSGLPATYVVQTSADDSSWTTRASVTLSSTDRSATVHLGSLSGRVWVRASWSFGGTTRTTSAQESEAPEHCGSTPPSGPPPSGPPPSGPPPSGPPPSGPPQPPTSPSGSLTTTCGSPGSVTVTALSDGGYSSVDWRLVAGSTVVTYSPFRGASYTASAGVVYSLEFSTGGESVTVAASVLAAGSCPASVVGSSTGGLSLTKAVSAGNGPVEIDLDSPTAPVLTYTLTAAATGATPQTNVVITDVVPGSTGAPASGRTTYVDGSASCLGAGSCTTSYDAGTHTLSWHIGDLAGGTSRSVTFQVSVDVPKTVGSLTIVNVGTVTSNQASAPVQSNVVSTPITAVLGFNISKPPAGVPGIGLTAAGVLPHTGVDLPLGWSLLVGAVLLGGGGVLLLAERRIRARRG